MSPRPATRGGRPRESELLVRAATGAAAGALGTLAMTGFMFLAKAAGLMGTMPPKKITQKLLQRLGARRTTTRTNVLTAVNHLLFGSALGVGYAALTSASHAEAGPTAGALYGGLVWTASYAGWVPALDIMPRPKHDRPGRPSSMLAAHLVFGAVAALALRKLSALARRSG